MFTVRPPPPLLLLPLGISLLLYCDVLMRSISFLFPSPSPTGGRCQSNSRGGLTFQTLFSILLASLSFHGNPFYKLFFFSFHHLNVGFLPPPSAPPRLSLSVTNTWLPPSPQLTFSEIEREKELQRDAETSYANNVRSLSAVPSTFSSCT